jgi:vacuolar-type H+-ATPase catalytic subunit A/Vma1
MKYLLLPVLALLTWSCNQESGYTKATDAQDAGREFIRASLDGDLKKAKFYILKDSANLDLLSTWKKKHYDKLNSDERRQYRDAQIRPVSIEAVNDSLVNYVYTNSYKEKDTTVLSVVRVSGEWLVDFKQVHGLKHQP